MKYTIIGITIFLLLSTSQIYSQDFKSGTNKSILKLYNLVDKYLSTDDEVINGCLYNYPSKKIKGNPFLKGEDWNISTLYIKNKKYTDYELKYDLVIDKIIIKSNNNNIELLIDINPFQVDSFIIDNSLFISSHSFFSNGNKTYYEQIFNSKLSMYRTYEKRFINMYDDKYPHGKFSILKTNLYIFENNKMHNAKNMYSFLHYFEKSNRKKIKSFMKENRIVLKNASNTQLRKIMIYCNSLLIK